MTNATVRDRQRNDSGRHGMRPAKAPISFDDARRMAIDAVRPITRIEAVPLQRALRRISAGEVRSRIEVPMADRAAMDGYAVRASDLAGATKTRAVALRRIETLYAGSLPKKRVGPGLCTELATGSTVPPGADAVVRFEDTRADGDRIAITAQVAVGENVSRRGSDIARGALVVRRGDDLTPAKIGALAAVGVNRAKVYAKPRVAILTTGDEVVRSGARLRTGQVYDINSNTIASVVEENGGEPVAFGRVADRLDLFRAVLQKALRNELVVVSGGSSVGQRDIVVDAIQSLGEVLFHGIAVKPGRPTALGVVGGTVVLCMPGNPTSCLSNGYVLLAPMLRRIARMAAPHPAIVDVPLEKPIRSALGRVEFHTVRIVDGKAVPAYKESGAITSMAHADGYIEIPADVDALSEGTTVRVTLF